MRKMSATRIDPAPSVWAYRFQRIMLTPAYRLAMRVGVPFLLSAGITSAYLASDARRDALLETFADIRTSFETRPQFMVNNMSIEGASPGISDDIREVAQIDFPVSSFDLDLTALQQNIATLPAVASVSLHVRKGGVLDVAVTERRPVALWRSDEGLTLVDPEGVVVGEAIARADRPDLPLIAGAGATDVVKQALRIIEAAGPISGRVRGLVRMGERRWDVVLDRGQRIMLPPDKPVQALERVIALDEAQDVLGRDLAAVDMRLATRPTLRMNEPAVQNWWKIKDIVVEQDGR